MKIESGKIDLQGLKKVGKGALIAGSGAALTYLTQNIGNIDFGQWTPIVVAGLGIVVNLLRKFLLSYESE